jgi:hypothetical protein
MTHVALTVALCSHAMQQILPIDEKRNIFFSHLINPKHCDSKLRCASSSLIINFSVYISHSNYQHV